jgi:hypothetical protein
MPTDLPPTLPSDEPPDQAQPPEPITPDEARARLDAALEPYLADDWVVRTRHDYMARLTRGGQNLDFYVDLLGEIQMEEAPLTPGQDSGRLVAWLLLIAVFLIIVIIATQLGWLG